jgi:MSHA pilin protein MshC
MKWHRSFRRAQGFTLLELIAVLMIVAVLAYFFAPRFIDRSGFEDRAFADQLLAGLRYGQKLARTQGRFVCVSLAQDTTTTVAFTQGADANCSDGPVTDAAGNPYIIFSNRPQFIPANTDGSFNMYDELGQPISQPVNGLPVDPSTMTDYGDPSTGRPITNFWFDTEGAPQPFYSNNQPGGINGNGVSGAGYGFFPTIVTNYMANTSNIENQNFNAIAFFDLGITYFSSIPGYTVSPYGQ